MSHRRFAKTAVSAAFAALAVLAAFAAARPAAPDEDWPPVTEEEKALKDCPQQPGAAAVFLVREEFSNHNDLTRSFFARLKILTPAGKERANIEIPYNKGTWKVVNLRARLVRPDGGTVPFAGEVFEKTAVRSGKFRVSVKSFAIPDVDAGCIIDYRYMLVLDESGSSSQKGEDTVANLLGGRGKPEEGGVDTERGFYFLRVIEWDLQEDLFTRRARFTYEPSDELESYLMRRGFKGVRLNWVSHGLEGLKPERKKGRIELELENIPAFEPEEFMTPERTQRKDVHLFYLDASMDSPDKYWREEGQNWQRGLESFLGKPGGASAEAQKLAAGKEDPLAKLRALYDRAQKVKNLSYDRTMTRQRRKELDIRGNRSVRDVFERGYGLRSDVTRTFAAMAAAAGFEVKVVRVSSRDDKFFDLNSCDLYSQFDTELAMVRVNGRDQLFDPATPYCPFGLVQWSCTGAVCLVPSDEPPSFKTTPAFPPDTALTQREIALRLDAEGNLAGTVRVTYLGQEALTRRVDHIGDDEMQVKKDLETELAALLPAGAKATLKGVENMANSGDRIVATFEIDVPGVATAAGRRTLIPVSPLLGGARRPFRHAQRTYPVYFPYPRREFDDIVISLPEGTKVETVPAARSSKGEDFDYGLICVAEGGTRIHVQRDLIIKKNFFPVDRYGAVKAFFDQVMAGDEEQVVLTSDKK